MESELFTPADSPLLLIDQPVGTVQLIDAGVVLTTAPTRIAGRMQAWATPAGKMLIGTPLGGLLPPTLR